MIVRNLSRFFAACILILPALANAELQSSALQVQRVVGQMVWFQTPSTGQPPVGFVYLVKQGKVRLAGVQVTQSNPTQKQFLAKILKTFPESTPLRSGQTYFALGKMPDGKTDTIKALDGASGPQIEVATKAPADNSQPIPATPTPTPAPTSASAQPKAPVPVNAAANAAAKKKKEEAEKARFQFGGWLGFSTTTYTETYSADYASKSISLGGFARYWMLDSLGFDLTANAVLFPVSMEPAIYTMRTYQMELDTAYKIPINVHWLFLVPKLGFYYTTSSVTNNVFGYAGLMGPSLQLGLLGALNQGQTFELVGRYALVKSGAGSFGTTNTEVGVNGKWVLPNEKTPRWFVQVDYRNLKFEVSYIKANSQILSLGVGMQW